MYSAKVGRWGTAFLLGLCLLTGSARAGGPILFNEEDGHLFPWLDNRAVYVVEGGNLGAIPNDKAAAMVAQAFKRWTDVPTANLRVENLEGILSPEALAPFKKDINAEDFTSVSCSIPALNDPPDRKRPRIICDMFKACIAQGGINCPSLVVFDEDGSITAQVFGNNNSVLGFSAPILFSVPPAPQPFRIVQSYTVLNGAFFDNNSQNTGVDDPTGTHFLEAVMVHEFGHFLGLDHSDVNGDTAGLNPAVTSVSTRGCGSPESKCATLGPVDALAAVRTDDAETMYPTIFIHDGVSPGNTLEKDDKVALSTLYPCTAGAKASGTCEEIFPCTAGAKASGLCEEVVSPAAITGTISGSVFIPDGAQAQRSQGVLVIARRIDANSPDDVLKEAVSQFTGTTFAPRRCTGSLFIDGDRDGNPDNDGDGFLDSNNPFFISGLFGACSTLGSAGFVECASQLNNNFLGRGERSFFFLLGGCGFFSFGFSSPRPVGDKAENRFELTGLSPGKYIVQATQALLGRFSPPLRSSFVPTPTIRSDDSVSFALFPNPQTGEYYNGLPTGCSNSTASCGKESGDASDNPFAFTPIEVTAGGRVDNVNIFLNTSTAGADIFSDPGFNFCGLGDVNRDGAVDQGDILAVVQAEAAFNPRADLNEDGSVTFLDVDIITDIVTIPRLIASPAPSNSELKRALAPFQAICTAAKNDGCKIQAPVETIQDDGTPAKAVCDTAKGIGCQVIGCQ